ncbi:MAG: methyltransferase, partial [Deltaproteobacteria bacterium]|nr:methyltransferase [Deltaproteobacteria bacterium]
ATDIDTEACRNARMNAALNHLDVDVRQGDLFAPIAGERFDGIVANLPFWPGSDSAPIGRAFSAGGDFQLLRRFVAGAPGYAQRAYIVLSEAFGAFPEARAALGPSARLDRRCRHRGEWLDLFAVE